MEHRWLRDEVDERLAGLFSEEPEQVRETMQAILRAVSRHEAGGRERHQGAGGEDEEIHPDELEELLVDTLQTSVDEQNDDTEGSVWIALLLGELRSLQGLGPLIASLVSDDESLAVAATRALQRIGEPAFIVLLERMEEDPDLDARMHVASIEVLEAVDLHGLRHLQPRVEESLLRTVRGATAAGADPELAGESPGTSALLGGVELERVEAAALALARLGVERARPLIEGALAAAGHSGFLEEALEIMREHPRGIPFIDRGWEAELGWETGAVEECLDPEIEITETPHERIVSITPPPPPER